MGFNPNMLSYFASGVTQTAYLRVISEKDQSLHHIYGVASHGEHFGHQVTVTLEECDGSQLDIKQQSGHAGERLQVFLSFIWRRSNQRLQTLRLNRHLEGRKYICHKYLVSDEIFYKTCMRTQCFDSSWNAPAVRVALLHY